MAKWTKIAATVLAAIAIILLSYSIFAEEPQTEETTTPGMSDRHIYSSTNLVIIVISSFLIAIAVMFILLREEYEPLPPTMKPAPPPPTDSEKGIGKVEGVGALESPEKEASPEAAEKIGGEDRRETYLILRLLTGDERRMFKSIMDAGGRALQKDLIKSTKMSNAKVSRVLDRLQEKGVVTKERHGSTNMVKITIEEG